MFLFSVPVSVNVLLEHINLLLQSDIYTYNLASLSTFSGSIRLVVMTRYNAIGSYRQSCLWGGDNTSVEDR